jgi:nucleoside-diphosphate-sugar epimerase
MKPQKILITGVYGAIGGAAYCRLSKQPELYDVFGADRRTDARGDLLPAFSPEIPKDRFLHGDISDLSFACDNSWVRAGKFCRLSCRLQLTDLYKP